MRLIAYMNIKFYVLCIIGSHPSFAIPVARDPVRKRQLSPWKRCFGA
jgi:hypothetical protein